MNREEILARSRQENKGRLDERETAALGAAARLGLLAGAFVCVILVLIGEFLLHSPVLGLAGWLVYFAMQGSSNLLLFKKLGARKKLLWGLTEILLAAVFAGAILFKGVV